MAKNAQCKKCQQKFYPKDIYTIQQFQYQKIPPYSWCLEFFKTRKIGEWDSFCQTCLMQYQTECKDEYEKSTK